MSLDCRQFEALVARLELAAFVHPRRYRLRVVAMALLGYAYLTAIFALLGLLLLGLVFSLFHLGGFAIYPILVLCPFIGLAVSAMWVSIASPVGLVVRAADAPALFERIERLRTALHAPRVHRVLITEEFNAAVCQIPRFGVLGFHRNFLLLGLPVLRSLSPEQLEAVIAHEFAHLRGGHARFGNWLYRLRTSWQQLQQAFESRRSSGGLLLCLFFRWYAPRFQAYTFPLARADEYAADATSAQICSSRVVAEALTGLRVVAESFDRHYWPWIHSRLLEEPGSACGPQRDLANWLQNDLPTTSPEELLQELLRRPTTGADSHPSLSDRLRAIGHSAVMALPSPGCAADVLIAPVLEEATRRLDERWRLRTEAGWRRLQEMVDDDHRRLEQLRAADVDTLSAAEVLERAELEWDFGRNRGLALGLLRRRLESESGDTRLQLALGTMLLRDDDAGGVEILRKALLHEPDARVAGYELLCNFHLRHGEREEAREMHRQYRVHCEIERCAEIERSCLKSRDHLESHGMSAAATAALRVVLGELGIRKAWLAQKVCRNMQHRPMYVLGFSCVGWWQLYPGRTAARLQQRIMDRAPLPRETLVLCVDKRLGVIRRLRKLADSRIF